MEECRHCGCNLILATGTLERLKEHVSPAGMAGTGERYTETLVTASVRNTLSALSNVEEICAVDLSDVKLEVNAAHSEFIGGDDDKAFDHALEASARFEQKFCQTRVNEE